MKKIRLVLETFLVHLAIWLLPKLSRKAILTLSNTFGVVAYLVDYRGRATAHENLRVAFAREHITPDQVRRIAVASYQTFTRTFFDLFWSGNLTRENYQDCIKVNFATADGEAVARGKGAIWVTPHFGNFELLNLAMGFRGFSIVVVAQDFKNPSLTGIFTRLRQGSGHQLIPQQGALVRIIKELKRGGHAALLTDLNVRPGKTASVIECFGLKTSVTTVHTSLAKRVGVPILVGTCLPLPDGSYRSSFAPPMYAEDYASPAAMAQAVWDHCEKCIREAPEAWLWMYKHWRYLPGTREDRIYPAYANPNRNFREMLSTQDQGVTGG